MPITRTKPLIGQAQFKAAPIEVEGDKRRFRVIASDESVDRYGDIVRADGWDLGNFKKNPVLLFGHDSSSPPIGTVIETEIKAKKLICLCEILPEGVYEFADTVWRIIKAGALRAVSVGFMPTEDPNVIRDDKNEFITGFEFIAQELYELSVVPVPANPNALVLSKSLALKRELVNRVLVPESASAFIAHKMREIDLIRLRDSSPRR